MLAHLSLMFKRRHIKKAEDVCPRLARTPAQLRREKDGPMQSAPKNNEQPDNNPNQRD